MATDKPGIEETYSGAIHSSNLRMEVREDSPNGAACVLIAVGWSPSRLGAALMRLHSSASREGVEQVHSLIAGQAAHWGIERPHAVAGSVLAWWLVHNCKACGGVRFELIKDTPMLSSRHCKACKGTGETPTPHGSDGRRLAIFMDDCVSRAQQSIKMRLRNTY